MPTYEYECQKCHHHFEVFQSIKDKPKSVCPKCKGKVKRLLGTGAGIIFKGSGFYVTDYRKPGYAEAAKKEGATAGASGAATDSASPKPKASKTAAKKD